MESPWWRLMKAAFSWGLFPRGKRLQQQRFEFVVDFYLRAAAAQYKATATATHTGCVFMSLFIYLFLYFLVASFHPTFHRLFTSLFSQPLTSAQPLVEQPDAVRKHSGAVRKAAASCRVLIGQSRMLGVNGKLLHDGAPDAVERSEEHRWRYSAFQLHQVLNQRFDQNNQSIEVLSPPKSMSLALWKIRALPRWTVWKY